MGVEEGLASLFLQKQKYHLTAC